MRFDKVKKHEYVDMGYKGEYGLVTENAEIHFIELPKFIKKKPGIENRLSQWLWLLTGEEEKIKMAEKGKEEGKKIGERNGKIAEKRETAKRLLDMGIKMEEIIKITQLTKEEIEKILDEQKNNIID